MFDTINHKTETTVTPVTRVVEKTITPDKVSDMYKEVRAEVEKNIVQMVKIESNLLNGVAIELRNSHDTYARKIYTRFILNGKDHVNTDFEDRPEIYTQEQLFNKLADHYAQVVRNELLKEAATALFKKTGLNR